MAAAAALLSPCFSQDMDATTRGGAVESAPPPLHTTVSGAPTLQPFSPSTEKAPRHLTHKLTAGQRTPSHIERHAQHPHVGSTRGLGAAASPRRHTPHTTCPQDALGGACARFPGQCVCATVRVCVTHPSAQPPMAHTHGAASGTRPPGSHTRTYPRSALCLRRHHTSMPAAACAGWCWLCL